MMSSGLDLDSGSGNAKFLVLGVLVLAFGVVGYLALGHGSPSAEKSNSVAAAVPAPAPAAPAALPAATDDTAFAQGGDTQTAATGVAVAEPNMAVAPADAPAVASEASPATDDAQSETAAAPASAPAVSDADANDFFATNTETQESSFSDESAPAVTHSTPRAAVRPPAPPALDALHAWWRGSAAHAFNVQYVGQAAGESALVFRFSKSIADSSAAAQHISVTSDNGAAASGIWKAGGNSYVLVYEGVQPGRYLVRIDPMLASAGGVKLGEPLQGAVYVQ